VTSEDENLAVEVVIAFLDLQEPRLVQRLFPQASKIQNQYTLVQRAVMAGLFSTGDGTKCMKRLPDSEIIEV
jgi:hypothetical protein